MTKIINTKLINYFPEYIPLELNKFDIALYCSVCEKKAILFKFLGERIIQIMSAQRCYAVECQDIDAFKKRLQNRDFKLVHEFLIKKDYDGLDYYCPECDKIYCIDHYAIFPIFEDSFYDYSVGVCPSGHKREVDD